MRRAVIVGTLGVIVAFAPCAWAAISDPVKIETGQLITVDGAAGLVTLAA